MLVRTRAARAPKNNRRAESEPKARRRDDASKGRNYTLLRRLPPARDGRGGALDRCGSMTLTVALLLVLEHLAVELVGERVDRRVHVGLDAFGVDVLAAHVHIGRYLLPELV